jgi:hypothetical protein
VYDFHVSAARSMRVFGKFVSRICPFSSIIAEARPAKRATASEDLILFPRPSTRRRWIVETEDLAHTEKKEGYLREINDVKFPCEMRPVIAPLTCQIPAPSSF